MKSIALATVVLAALVHAQQSPPQCATDCVAQTPTSCSQSDLLCLCHDNNFITQATQCILTTCQGSDVSAAEQFAQGLCASVGVTLTSTPPIPTSTGGSESSSGTDTATATGTSQTGTTSESTSAATSGTGSQTSPAASPTTSPGSAVGLDAGITAFFGAALALFLL